MLFVLENAKLLRLIDSLFSIFSLRWSDIGVGLPWLLYYHFGLGEGGF